MVGYLRPIISSPSSSMSTYSTFYFLTLLFLYLLPFPSFFTFLHCLFLCSSSFHPSSCLLFYFPVCLSLIVQSFIFTSPFSFTLVYSHVHSFFPPLYLSTVYSFAILSSILPLFTLFTLPFVCLHTFNPLLSLQRLCSTGAQGGQGRGEAG